MIESVHEGVAFGIRDMVEAARNMGIKVEKSMICGGGSKSPLWRRIFASVLNLELTIPMTEQGPGFGAAILAMVACKVYGSVKEATDALIKVKETIKPEAPLVEKYEKKYAKFRTLYPTLKETFRKELA
jgi:xylulokinase